MGRINAPVNKWHRITGKLDYEAEINSNENEPYFEKILKILEEHYE